ncbi:MAG: RNA-binding S4 domain-containing protein [Bacteroidetes bacterium]|nr:RNA-binding S4 domain-containing protein [Bacteroidota bacterium]MBU1720159.1 RNA-binding S4 domain-containing protein [Bacteroidota bacterium]
MQQETGSVRIDKYLWSVRIFKSRSIASDACIAGKVKIDGDAVKPSRKVKPEEIIMVQKEQMVLSFRVRAILERRVSAVLAKEFVEDITPEEERQKVEMIRLTAVKRDRGTGRPTKKERREIDKYM